MSCCVPDCETTAENAADKSKPDRTMVMLLDFPTDTNTVNIWQKSLGIKNPLPSNAKICSLHFLEDDIKFENGMTQISDGAIPLPLQFCVMCLDTENKLYCMSKYKLEDMYETFTGIPVCKYTNLRPAICMKCLETLIRLNKFRQMGLKSCEILTKLGMY